jgi:threonine dehydratase
MVVRESETASRIRQEALQAERRIVPYVRETTLEHSAFLSERSGAEVYLKLENLQITGSFKLRGAANALLSLSPEERGRGVVTASTGNHGAAVAHLAGVLGCSATIFVPKGASGIKVERLRRLGADLQFYGEDCVEAELHARSSAEEDGRAFISPYNDSAVIAGQATVGLEIEHQLEELDAVLVPVGGGGLIAGVAASLKALRPDVEVVGCQPELSAVMCESIRAGHIVELPILPTLSDGTAGGVEPGAISFEICRELVDDFVLVSEQEITAALRLVIEQHHLLIEGAAALPVAALLQRGDSFHGRRVVLVLSGGCIGLDTLSEILDSE